VSDRRKITKPRAWVKVLLVLAVGLAAIALVGRLSVLLSLPNTNTDTKQYLEDRSRESGKQESATDSCWIEPPDLAARGLRGGEKDGSWGYVRSKSTLPFFIRTHFGHFSDAETSDDSIEGVRTYFSLFGKELLLNEWSVEHERE
jgi:hypothetical protein